MPENSYVRFRKRLRKQLTTACASVFGFSRSVDAEFSERLYKLTIIKMKKLSILTALTLIIPGFIFYNKVTAKLPGDEKELVSLETSSSEDELWQCAMTPIDDSAWAADLEGKNGLTRVSLRDIDLNREGEKVSSFPDDYGFSGVEVKAFEWQAGDNSTDDWRPQGIAGIRLENPGYSMVAVTWYDHDDSDKYKGVRISFVDVTPGSDNRFHYRHVLLVERDGNNFKPVGDDLHAGGLVYSKGFLFIPDTKNGIRVFDTRNIYNGVETDNTKTKCGFDDGKAYAFNYTYILPQVYNYSNLYSTLITTGMAEESGNNPKFSYLSICWSGERKLLTGSYMNKGNMEDGLSPSMFLWKLSSDEPGKLVAEKPRNLGIETGLKRYRWIQGAALYDSVLYISRSVGLGIKKHTVSGSWENDDYSVDREQISVLPTESSSSDLGFEDLHISLSSDILWGLSEGSRSADPEFTGDRIVFWISGVK